MVVGGISDKMVLLVMLRKLASFVIQHVRHVHRLSARLMLVTAQSNNCISPMDSLLPVK